MDICNRPIGVFDSGIGGVSVLRNMARLMPHEKFIYYGDDKNAPYGTRPESEILSLARADVRFLMDKNVKAVVIACNTATSAAAAYLRAALDIPVIGMEPALKPAALNTKRGEIAVLATPATLKQDKFQRLMLAYGSHAVPVPCPGLMEFVERGELSGARLDECVKSLISPFAHHDFTSAVLGCTHYVFIAPAIARALPNAELFDGNEGTSRQLMRVLGERSWLNPAGEGGCEFYTSGDPVRLIPLMKTLFSATIY